MKAYNSFSNICEEIDSI